jgi:FlaA1/EpsC-like NDP-sugar epimerase
MPELEGKHVFVTGGTGSFGSTLVKRCLASKEVAKVTVYSRDEQKHVRMRRRFTDERLHMALGDVRDLERLRTCMKGVDVVFNAAALKHVHLTESHPMEAVKTNVVGAANVCKAAIENGVEVLVSLSTDKAVEPVNAMGMSKALQERVLKSFSGHGTRIGIVRYGNVLASNGSVIPLFKRLIEAGAPSLPVTDRRMSRFVLSLDNSVDLVLLAVRESRAGETFVMDLPALLIWDVAEVMAEYAGERGRGVRVEEIGVRPGEKIHETLISSEEMRHTRPRDGFWVIDPVASSEVLFSPGRPDGRFSSDSARRLTRKEIAAMLEKCECLPEIP